MRLNAGGGPNCTVATNGYTTGVGGLVRPQFTGQPADNESGLDFFGARYYSSAAGRFMSPDGPFNDQNVGDPQSWNLYGYVRSNPLANSDPTGRSCIYNADDTGQEHPVGDDGDSKGCAGAGVAAGNPNNVESTLNPNNYVNQTVNSQVEPFSFGDVFKAGLDFITNSIVPLPGTFGVGLPQAGNSIGPQVGFTYIPKTRRLCVSGGVYATNPGSNFVNASVGLLVNGPLGKVENVVSGFGASVTLQQGPGSGYQVRSSPSGNLGGPTAGTRGTSVGANYGGCFSVGAKP